MSGSGETQTPFLGLIQPPVGADQDVWGDRWNTNATTIDTNASSNDSRLSTLEAAVAALQNATPPQEIVGSIKWWPANALPTGWLNCDGVQLSTTTYAALFAVLGYTYGGGGGVFAIPDMRGLVLVGLDQGAGRLQGQYGPDTTGQVGGTALYTLQASQMPPHAHGGSTDTQGQHAHDYGAWTTGSGYYIGGNYTLQASTQNAITDQQGLHAHGIATDVQGGGQPHPNVQPGMLGYWIIKAVML